MCAVRQCRPNSVGEEDTHQDPGKEGPEEGGSQSINRWHAPGISTRSRSTRLMGHERA